MQYAELVLRWIHIVAGVIWIGHLYFFNFVNASFAPTMDGDTKKKVVPQLMPRALFWFRWGAAWTFLTGVFLAFLVYYHGYGGSNLVDMATRAEKVGAMDWLPAFLGLIVGFLVYDLLFKALAKQHNVAVVAWAVLALAFAWLCKETLHYSTRAVFIHQGALFGTTMMMNVWMRIWPAQRRIITATKNGQAPDPADPALAGLRSKHNTYMSVPLLLYMLLGAHSELLGNAINDYYIVIPVILVVGFGITWALYGKAKKVPGF
jgi:uncharacterized membrane protein